MKKPLFMFLLGVVFSLINVFPQSENSIHRVREDGRSINTYGFLHNMLKNHKPKLEYDDSMSVEEFKVWQNEISNAMLELMNFPRDIEFVEPKCISSETRDGYSLEKWEFYPLPGLLSTFLVLKPETISKPLPAVMCIPGSSRTKEGLAGEMGIYDCYTEDINDEHVTMALDYVKAGYVAVAVDNAGSGEAADIEYLSNNNNYNYDLVSRILLEMGWSWLGYTSYLDMEVLKWMKKQEYIDRKHIIISGFSLGTEPMMVLGVLDKEIFGFVYNDFLCNTQERAVVMSKPIKGRRNFPNSIRHLIPGYWKYFNFPDVVASLAPRHIIFTEGGLDRDFELVKKAYKKVNASDNIKCYHYPKYANKPDRFSEDKLPENLDASTYFEMVNVDTSNHYFKSELVIPWINSLFEKE